MVSLNWLSNQGLFDPSAAKQKKDTAAMKKRAQEQIKDWVKELLPDEMKPAVALIACREFQVRRCEVAN